MNISSVGSAGAQGSLSPVTSSYASAQPQDETGNVALPQAQIQAEPPLSSAQVKQAIQHVNDSFNQSNLQSQVALQAMAMYNSMQSNVLGLLPK